MGSLTRCSVPLRRPGHRRRLRPERVEGRLADDSRSASSSGVRSVAAQPYPAETLLARRRRRGSLTSKKARRELGWARVLAKALQPASWRRLQTATVTSPTKPLVRERTGAALPHLVRRRRVRSDVRQDVRRPRQGASASPRTSCRTAAEIDKIFDWNAKSLGPNSETEYFARASSRLERSARRRRDSAARPRGLQPRLLPQYLTDYPATRRRLRARRLEVEKHPESRARRTPRTASRTSSTADAAAVIKASVAAERGDRGRRSSGAGYESPATLNGSA